LVLGTPPEWAHEPPLGEEVETEKYSPPAGMPVHAFPETVAWKGGAPLHGIFVTGAPHRYQ
jgi:hypothetical protein